MIIIVASSSEGPVIEVDAVGIDHLIASLMDLSTEPEGIILNVFGLKFRRVSE